MSMFHSLDKEGLFNIFYELFNFLVLGPFLNFSPTNRSPFLTTIISAKLGSVCFSSFSRKDYYMK